MSEYIKKEDAENIVLGSCDESALWKLRHIPPADVVEVVRCKDCMWWTKQEDSLQGRCTLMQSCPTGAWYCMNGERKNNE